ncbi:MAG: ABC transporter permease subunit, partial [Steroidobacteraceae bacterium]
DNQGLREAFDGFLAGIRADGTYQDMIQRWFVRKERTMPPLPAEGTAGTLTIGTAAFGFPYGAIQDGEFAGFDIELARRFAASQGKQAEFLQMDFGGLIAAQVAGKVDMLVTGMFITPERKERIDFSDPYYNTEIRVFALKQNMGARPAAAPGKPKLTSIGDIHGRRVGVVLGSAQDVYLRKAYPTAEVLQFDHGADLILGLTTDRIDMAVADRDFVRENVATQAQLGVLDEPLFASEVAAGFSKSNPALRADFNAFLANIRADGTYQDMVDRWFKRGERVMPELPAEGSAGVLRVGTSAGGYPFGAVFNGEFSGFDIELARRFAASQGKRAQFSHMQFASLIAALTSGKVDMLTTSMFITEERKERIDFSDPYYATDTRVFALKEKMGAPPRTGSAKPKPTSISDIRAQSGGGPAKPEADAPIQIRSNDDLAGIRVGTVLGSAQDAYVRKNYPTSQVLQYNTSADLVMAVEGSRVEAGVAGRDSLNEILADNTQLAMLETPLFSMDIGAGFKKGNQALREAFNRFLAEIRADGTYDDMVQRWFVRKERTMPTLPAEGTAGTLTIGTATNGFPFGAIQDGKLAGFDIELARRFAASQGKQATFLDMDFGGLIAAQVAGKVDMLVTAMFITPERKERIDFSDPYYSDESRVFALKQNIEQRPKPSGNKLATPADLHGRRIGVMLGSAQEGFATKTFTDSEILQYRTAADLVLAVHDGKVDAGFMDGDPLREILAQQPGFAILGEPLFVSEAGAGFSKASIELRDQFNQFLAGIRADGTYDDMIERWIRGKDSTMPTLPEKPRQGKLTVATNDFGLPFVAVQDGRLVGFDMELAERFAHFLGREVELLNMDWSAVIAATVSGKADVGLGCMFITEERKQNILFSDPYYEAESLAIVLASRAAGADAEAAQPPTAPSWLDGLKASIESNLVRERRYLLIWDGLKTTVVISIFATIFGTLLGGLVCMMRMSSSRWLQWPARSYIAVLRGTPVLVLLMLIFYVVFASVDISPVFVAVVAFGMNFAAYVAEIYRSGIQSIDRGQSEAGIAMGFSRFRTFLYVILPQTVQRILPVYKGEFISLVKMTSIVGYIAVQDLTKASDIIRSRTFDAFFPLVMVAILYFVIAWVLIQALEYLERRTDPKQRRRKAVSK